MSSRGKHRSTTGRMSWRSIAADHLLLLGAASNQNALKADLPAQCGHELKETFSASQNADQRYVPATRTAAMECSSVDGPPTSTT